MKILLSTLFLISNLVFADVCEECQMPTRPATFEALAQGVNQATQNVENLQTQIELLKQKLQANDLESVRTILAKEKVLPSNFPDAFLYIKSRDAAQLLGFYQFDINYQKQPSRESVLQHFIKLKDAHLITILIENGGNPEITDASGNNAFHTLASVNDPYSTVSFFNIVGSNPRWQLYFDKINEVNKSGCRPLNYITNSEVKEQFKFYNASSKFFGCSR